jgi:hypothetical protein
MSTPLPLLLAPLLPGDPGPDLAVGDARSDDGVRSRKLRRAVKLAWTSNNATVTLSGLYKVIYANSNFLHAQW